jgi:hypothetical protein
MGNGRFKNGRFDMVVVANFLMTANDWTEWERSFKKVSEILYNASEGQMQFGKLFVCDDSIGLSIADAILYPDGDPSYSSGSFGHPGAAIHLMPYVKRQVLTVLHEMGHHVWDLGDEYCGPYFFDEIDKTDPAPDRRTIPIANTGRADNELSDLGAKALLMFGSQYERRNVIANTATTVTVDIDFSDLPTNSDHDWVMYQTDAECSQVAQSNYCIMERSRSAAGYFDAAGNWIDVTHPVTEFCAASNHDPDEDTQQEANHGKSCWEVIQEQPGFSSLTVPDPAGAGPTAGWIEPEWVVLDKQPRFALVLDRSGSMSTGHKMADAQHGAIYWLEFYALGNDLLTIIWYDHAIDRILDLTPVSTLPNLDTEINAINALMPRGSTNIRDGLYEALDQIETPATRAAVQAVLLLTDGKHNTPYGSQATEVLPAFQERGTRIYTLGVGDAYAVNMDVLDQLAADTGANSYAVGDDQPGVIEAAMVEINAEVRGGIITTDPAVFPDSRKSALDEVIAEMTSGKELRRLTLDRLCEILEIKTVEQLVNPSEQIMKRLVAIPIDVEEKCERVTFTLVYPEGYDLWLYLVDPNGKFVNMYSSAIQHVISKSPHEFAIVGKPTAGRWYMIALRPEAGASFRFQAIAGGENRRLQTFGGANPKNCPEAPVRLWASARWGHEMSNLHVTATVAAPDGGSQRLRLDDNRFEEPNSGIYEGYVSVKRPGRYHGTILIENHGDAIIAKPARRLLDQKKNVLSVIAKVPKFVREVPFYFDSGDRPEIKDEECSEGLTEKYEGLRPRPTKLKSAVKRIQKGGKTKRSR